MVLGLGIDIVEVVRMQKSIENEAFIRKVFTQNEITYCESKKNKAESYAVRFAAKEAFSKAMGTGFRGEIAFTEIEISNDDMGKPLLKTSGNTDLLINEKQIKNITVSLSHTKTSAVAVVILQA